MSEAQIVGPDPGRRGEPDMSATAKWLETKYGFVSNLAQTLAHTPGALMPWLNLEHYCRFESALTERQRMLVILIAVRDVHYCWPHYKPMANTVGFSDEQISLIRQGRVPLDIAEVEQIICQATNEIVASRRVPQTVYDELVRRLPPRQVVDIGVIASFYMAMGALSTGLAIEVEMPEVLRREQAHHKKAIGLA
jgi:4-carboxymuconolactone decarboxylase